MSKAYLIMKLTHVFNVQFDYARNTTFSMLEMFSSAEMCPHAGL